MVRVFKQYIPVSFVILGFVEFFLLMLSMYAGVAFRFAESATALDEMHLPSSVGVIYTKALAYSLVMLLSLSAMGLYQRRFRHGIAGMSLRVLSAFLGGGVAMSLVY